MGYFERRYLIISAREINLEDLRGGGHFLQSHHIRLDFQLKSGKITDRDRN